MRFKGTLIDIDSIITLAKVVNTCSKLAKSAVLRLTTTKLYFIIYENQLQGGTSFWCELPQKNLFSGYDFVGHSERNETFIEVSLDSFSHALKSAQNAKVLRIKLTQKATACLTLDIVLPSLSSKSRTVIHDIPIKIIPSRLWDEYAEPKISEFDVSMYLPPLKVMKSVIDRLKNISSILCISCNNAGDMLIKVKSEMASVSVSFKDLLQASWKDSTLHSQHSQSSTSQQANRTDFFEVAVDVRRLHLILSHLQLHTDKIICNVVGNEAVQLFFFYDQLSMHYTIPAQNVV